MKWRDTQLQWYDGKMLAQDQQLIDFAKCHDIGNIKYLGDSKYLQQLMNGCKGPAHLVVYIVNHEHKLDDVVDQCNTQLASMPAGNFLYLSLNKFLMMAMSNPNASDNYDDAIFFYVRQNVKHHLLAYQNGMIDGGKRFNWVHPLTRFYFTNADSE